MSHLPGFEVPLYRSLTDPILLGGAPRNIAILNGTLAAALGLGLRLCSLVFFCREMKMQKRILITPISSMESAAFGYGSLLKNQKEKGLIFAL